MKRLATRWLLVGLKVSVSVSLIAYLLRRVDVSELARRAEALSAATSTVALLVLICYIAVGGARWLIVLRAIGTGLPMRAGLRISFVGAFFNQLLPATVGADAIRVWESYRAGVTLGGAVRSVIFERAGYLFAVSLAAAIGASTWRGGRLPAGMANSLWLLVFLAAAGAAFAFFVRPGAISRFAPPAFRHELASWFFDWRSLLRSKGAIASLMGGSVLGLAMLAGAVMILAAGLGIRLSFLDCAALFPAAVLASALPISVAGWGVRELAMVTLFGFAGMAPPDALALSISLALFSALSALPGGALWVFRSGRPSKS